MTRLDPKRLSPASEMMVYKLNNRIVGQDRAVQYFVKALQKYEAGIQDPRRPLAVVLLMGPTGVGKTEIVHALAESYFGDWDSLTQIDCTEYQREHEVSKLIGSPPGYVGDKIEPRLSQSNIDQYQRINRKMNIVLFDEIEKADIALFDLLLGIMSKGSLGLGSGKNVDFTKTLLCMTSNLGTAEMTKKKLGFVTKLEREVLDQDFYTTSKAAAVKNFRPEFMNRIDRIIVCRSLSPESSAKILDLELRKLQRRMFLGSDGVTRFPVIFTVSKAAKKFLLDEGIDQKYGARELKRTIERFVTEPLSSLLATRQIESGDRVAIDYEGTGDLVFDGTKDLTLSPPVVPYSGGKPEDLVH